MRKKVKGKREKNSNRCHLYTNTYQNAIDILTSQGKFYVNLGLERVQKILEILGNPEQKLKYVHVAGTNGRAQFVQRSVLF